MWGCIALSIRNSSYIQVPSLYVRVYREIRQRYRLSYSSLIICEGVSEIAVPVRIFRLFPHYMWGCIASAQWSGRLCMVPSLYVRVYHVPGLSEGQGVRSLIICEGVSWTITRARASRKFPHYTWGCIGAAIFHRTPAAVPSLYVRVYQMAVIYIKTPFSSLTIREGVSLAPTVKDEDGEFPHCMWGCIL